MKRFFTILSIAAVALAACNKENEEPGQKIDPSELVEVTFEVSAKPTQAAEVQNASTKTEIKEDGTVHWSVGDKVSVFYGVNGETGSSESEALTAENINADGSASITVKVPTAFTLAQFDGTRSLSAVYPFDAIATYVDGKINVSAPKVQDGTFAHASLSVAEWNGTNSLTFENQCGLLRIEAVDAAVSKITLKSADADVVTLNVFGVGTYYAAVAPSTLEGFSVVLTDAEGEELAKKVTTNSLVVEKGHVVPLGKIAGFDDRFYVSVEAKGRKDGSNWDNAAGLSELKALLAKGSVMNVYMSAGTYSVTTALVSEADGADFSVYGGYPADAKGASLKARDAKANATIFDGGGKSQIWLTKKGNVLFDGLTFQNGYKADDNGGALVFNGTGVTGKILDCTFTDNKVYTEDKKGYSGGAIHVGEATVTVENCSFSKNYGRNGGSLYTDNAKAELTVKGCTFTEDYTYNTGGSINNTNGTQIIENCTFTSCYNQVGVGGAIHINGASAVQTLKNCVFSACEANQNNSYTKVDNKACGGAISVQNAYLDIIGCTFDGNMGVCGSAMLLQSGDGLVRVTDCVFKNNKGASRGLIQTNGKAVLFMNNCQIFDNTLRTNVWGTVIHGSNPSVVCMNNCSIYNNVSQQAGGSSVCLNNDGFTIVVNTTVVGENAKSLCRSNNNTDSHSFSMYDNCILANKHANGIVFFKEANSSVKLYNDIIGPKATNADGSWLEKTNVVVDGELSFCNGSDFDYSKGYWKWNGPSESFPKAKEADIIARLNALDSNNGNTRLKGAFAPKFVEWVNNLGGFNKDQLGTTRTTSGTWPGSVELK
jgi:hypothetical protein